MTAMTATAEPDPGVPDVLVVIREAGERTVGAACALCEAQVGADRVATIREVPFAAALRRGLEVGAEAGRRWTLCLDADVLLREGAIADLVAAAERAAAANDALFGVSGTVADPLLGQVRHAGNHLYRTAHLAHALEAGSFDPAKRRPETVVKKQMHRLGHGWINLDAPLVGLHDAEQWFRDIVRKTYTHARKHERFMRYAERYWLRRAEAEADARVALCALALARMQGRVGAPSGARADENVAIDMRRFAQNVDAILIPLGLGEKPALAPGAITADAVARRLDAFAVAPEFLSDEPFIRAETGSGWRAALGRLHRTSGLRPVLAPLAPLLRSRV